EVQHVFTAPKLAVERNRRRIYEVGLDEGDVRAALLGDGADGMNERRRDPLAAVGGRDSEIVDVKLAARLLELAQLVGGDAPHHVVLPERREGDEARAIEQLV